MPQKVKKFHKKYAHITLYFPKARNAAVLQSSEHGEESDLGAGLGCASGGLEWPSGLGGLD